MRLWWWLRSGAILFGDILVRIGGWRRRRRLLLVGRCLRVECFGVAIVKVGVLRMIRRLLLLLLLRVAIPIVRHLDDGNVVFKGDATR